MIAAVKQTPARMLRRIYYQVRVKQKSNLNHTLNGHGFFRHDQTAPDIAFYSEKRDAQCIGESAENCPNNKL